jgi:hypothetical protein
MVIKWDAVLRRVTRNLAMTDTEHKLHAVEVIHENTFYLKLDLHEVTLVPGEVRRSAGEPLLFSITNWMVEEQHLY